MAHFSSSYTSQGQVDFAFTNLTDTEAVELFGKFFYKEIKELQYAETTVESGLDRPKGSLIHEQTPSRYLYGADFAEVNRTVVSMLALKWILAHDYEAFTANQHEQVRLSRDSFHHLCEFFMKRIRIREKSENHPENQDDKDHHIDIYSLLVAVVLDDLGKVPNLSKVLEEEHDSNFTKPELKNHSDILSEAAKKGMIPLLKTVPERRRNIIVRNMEMEGNLNISQLVQAENVPGSIRSFMEIMDMDTETGRESLDMRAMVALVDVAGAAAHTNANGCLVMIESVYQAYMSALKALNELVSGNIDSERACYDQILSDRATSLESKGYYDKLSTDNEEQRALLRLFCMGRVDNSTQANIFKKAFYELPTKSREQLINGLNVDGIDDGKAILPYYAPGLISEVLRSFHHDKKDEKSIINALSAFLRFLTRVFEGTKKQPGSRGIVIERNLAFVKGVIKSNEFRDDFSILDNVPLKW